jgi:hypothetical protein
MNKKSSSNMRFEFQPNIMIETSMNCGNNSDSEKNMRKKATPESHKNNYLNIKTSTYKKQKTLTTKREKQGSKNSCDKSSIKKSVTKSSKWGHYQKSSQKDVSKSASRSKTLERKFTISSSISSIR